MGIIVTLLVSFALTAILGRFLIPSLHALKAGQSIREIGPKWHQVKSGTPTMGGIMFIVPTALLVVLGSIPAMKNG